MHTQSEKRPTSVIANMVTESKKSDLRDNPELSCCKTRIFKYHTDVRVHR